MKKHLRRTPKHIYSLRKLKRDIKSFRKKEKCKDLKPDEKDKKSFRKKEKCKDFKPDEAEKLELAYRAYSLVKLGHEKKVFELL